MAGAMATKIAKGGRCFDGGGVLFSQRCIVSTYALFKGKLLCP